MQKKPIPEIKTKTILQKETKRLLKYPNGIYLLSLGKLIPNEWKNERDIILEIQLLEANENEITLKLRKVQKFEIVRE